MKKIQGSITAPKGFYASGVHCGLRKNKAKLDLALIYCDRLCNAAAVYTKNLVKGAPIKVTMENLKDGKAQAIICNSGNANTCNSDGMEKAYIMCNETAKALNISQNDIIIASTGVIGQPINIEAITNGIPVLASTLTQEKDGADQVARAIMTTDTRDKKCAVSFKIADKEVKIGGVAKGSGMIHPNMATMLCFITTDVAIDNTLLNKAILAVADETFNMVSVDGDTSTNDMLSIMASGAAENEKICDKNSDAYKIFYQGLLLVCMNLARKLAKDGEGATKLLECIVCGAPDKTTAKQCAKSVITSSLVKSAFFGADANWGRILCALGYAGMAIDVSVIEVAFQSTGGYIKVCTNGSGLDFSEEHAKRILTCDEIQILINLNSGECEATAWGCDLTYDYVKINGDYRT